MDCLIWDQIDRQVVGYHDFRPGVVINQMVAKELKINKLPSVPEVLLKLVSACRKPQVILDEVVSIIQHDAALTARIFDIASTDFRLEKVDRENFKALVSGLGVDVISSIASSTAVDQFFSRFWSGTDQHIGLWRVSLECACLARALARAVDYPEPEEAYLAGLLHNLGRWVYLSEFPEEYASVGGSDQGEQDKLSYEKDLFGLSSVEYAASLTVGWTRDALLSDAVLFQNQSTMAVLDSPELIRLLNLACRLIASEPWEDKSVFDDADRLLGLNAGQVLEVRARAKTEQEEIIAGYGLQADATGDSGAKGIRKALSDHVHDSALVSAINIAASDDPWQAAISYFEVLSGVSEVAAFEYHQEDNLLHSGRFGSNVDGDRFKRLDIPVRSGRNLLAEACLMKSTISTLDEGLPPLTSVLHTQLQRIFGKQELLAMPVISGHEVLGLLVAGLDTREMEELLRYRSRLDYFLAVVAAQLRVHVAVGEDRVIAAESRVHEYVSRTRRLIHEANNPLGIVANYLQILSMKFEQDHDTQKQINVIKEEIDRVSGILTSLRGVPENIGNQTAIVDINNLLEEIVSIFRVSLFEPNGITCDLRLDRAIPEIHSVPSHLKQVITNLLKNSVEALESKGKGTIAVETNDAVYFDGRQCVRIVIADNGPGISQNVIDHLFTSAVSSKGAPHSGVGLMVVKSLVSEMGGNVLVYSREEEGARFEIFLPRG